MARGKVYSRHPHKILVEAEPDKVERGVNLSDGVDTYQVIDVGIVNQEKWVRLRNSNKEIGNPTRDFRLIDCYPLFFVGRWDKVRD